jgi:hypothetical protein
MSTLPDNEFDLEKLFLPAWAQEEPSSAKYAKYEGREERTEERRDRRGPRRRDTPPGARRDGGRPSQDRRGPPGGERTGPRTTGADRYDRGERRGPQGAPRERREPPAPLAEINITLVPEEKGVESLARQIKMTGRAYPLFDIAQMILQKPERYAASFSVKKNPEGQPVQPLFVCALDDSLWLSEDEAVSHVLRKHFATFYQAERTATEPPKGKYTFVAQCGMSGIVLGPPNYHDYQNQLRKLHAERFSRMPFDIYKARVKIVRDEEVVKKWVEDQSWKTEYLCLNMPEAARLASMEAVEQHFRENHKANIIKQVETYTLSGTAARSLRSPELTRLFRTIWEDQRRFPLQIATVLSQQFAGHGLQFFKVNKSITHVSVARPHYLDLALTPVSDGVKKIVDYVNANPKCTRRKLMEVLAPSPPPAPPIATPTVAQVGATTEPQAPQSPTPTPEQNALIGDLHWLIHQGHVIEFANGTLDTAKKPLPRPPKPAPKREEKTTETPAGELEQPAASETEADESAATQSGAQGQTSSAENAAPASTSESFPPDSGPGNEQALEQTTVADKPQTAAPEGGPTSNPVEAAAELPAAPVESSS